MFAELRRDCDCEHVRFLATALMWIVTTILVTAAAPAAWAQHNEGMRLSRWGFRDSWWEDSCGSR